MTMMTIATATTTTVSSTAAVTVTAVALVAAATIENLLTFCCGCFWKMFMFIHKCFRSLNYDKCVLHSVHVITRCMHVKCSLLGIGHTFTSNTLNGHAIFTQSICVHHAQPFTCVDLVFVLCETLRLLMFTLELPSTMERFLFLRGIRFLSLLCEKWSWIWISTATATVIATQTWNHTFLPIDSVRFVSFILKLSQLTVFVCTPFVSTTRGEMQWDRKNSTTKTTNFDEVIDWD